MDTLTNDSFNDMFSPPSQQDKEKYAQSQKELADAIQRTAQAAQSCLNSELFHGYRRQYQNAEKMLISVIIQYTRSFFSEDRGDMNKYGAQMARYITKLDDMRMLLRQVDNDAKRTNKKESNDAKART